MTKEQRFGSTTSDSGLEYPPWMREAVKAAKEIGEWLRLPQGREVVEEARRTPEERVAHRIAQGEKDPRLG